MKTARTSTRFLMAAIAVCLFAARLPAADQTVNDPLNAAGASATADGQMLKSPLEPFRKMLAMTPAEREVFLTNYPAGARERIIAKVEEYQLLPQPLSELRLQVTELRWYLLPLMKSTPTNRVAQLSVIPEPYRELVTARIEEWDILPPPLKDEVLEYESTMNVFVGRGAVVQPQPAAEDLSAWQRRQEERKLARWQKLPARQREEMYARFQRYFDLNDEEKERTLAVLSEPQRRETELALQPIEQWPRAEQSRYFAAFQQFANMSPNERRQFMRSAERWRQMAESERQAWRDLVGQLADLPPLPIGFIPPGDQPVPTGPTAGGSTNPSAAPER